jgi:hypothetical protein
MVHSILLALALQVGAPAPRAELQPLAFLVGSCWRADSPNATETDIHCYTAMLGGRYIRDVHVVEGPGPPYSGETVYRWDPRARRIRFDYYASDGGYSWGFVNPTPGGLDFPGDRYVGGDGRTMTMRTVQTHQRDGYTNASFARRSNGRWRKLWTTRFIHVRPAPAP